MEILEQIKEQEVTDYDFMFQGGSKLAVIINHDIGDTVKELHDRYVLDIKARPNLVNNEEPTNPEIVEVFKTHLAFVSTCHRKQRAPTAEEAFDFHQLLHKATTKVQ